MKLNTFALKKRLHLAMINKFNNLELQNAGNPWFTLGQFFCDSLDCCLDPCHV